MSANYGALKTDIGIALARADLTARIPDYVAGALARINGELAAEGGIVDQEQLAYAATVPGSESLELPSDFDRLEFIKIGTDALEAAQGYDELLDEYGDERGQPKKYALFASALCFRPIPDAVYEVRIGYLKRYPMLAGDADTNWLLAQGGNLLLYAACLEATPQLGDDQRIVTWGGAYKGSLRLILDANARAKRAPRPAEVRLDAALLAMGTGMRGDIVNGP